MVLNSNMFKNAIRFVMFAQSLFIDGFDKQRFCTNEFAYYDQMQSGRTIAHMRKRPMVFFVRIKSEQNR